MAVVVLGKCCCCEVIKVDTSLQLPVIRKYIVIPCLYSIAIFSNGKLLEYANVETFMVFRFSVPILVGLTDFLLMGKTLPTPRSAWSFLMILGGAILYAVTDVGFALRTYSWAILYLVVITTEMIVVKHLFNTIEMTDWTRVYLNNLLSLPFQPIFFLMTSEQTKLGEVLTDEHVDVPYTTGILLLSCILGLSLAWSGATLRARVSATTFTVVGVACKCVTEFVNYIMWDKHANTLGMVALAFCLAGSTIYRPAPQRDSTQTVSNSAWDLLNQLTGGILARIELEPPGFQHDNKLGEYEAIPVVEPANQNDDDDIELQKLDLQGDQDIVVDDRDFIDELVESTRKPE